MDFHPPLFHITFIFSVKTLSDLLVAGKIITDIFKKAIGICHKNAKESCIIFVKIRDKQKNTALTFGNQSRVNVARKVKVKTVGQRPTVLTLTLTFFHSM